VTLNDRYLDVIEEDSTSPCASGHLEDSSLIARRLGAGAGWRLRRARLHRRTGAAADARPSSPSTTASSTPTLRAQSEWRFVDGEGKGKRAAHRRPAAGEQRRRPARRGAAGAGASGSSRPSWLGEDLRAGALVRLLPATRRRKAGFTPSIRQAATVSAKCAASSIPVTPVRRRA